MKVKMDMVSMILEWEDVYKRQYKDREDEIIQSGIGQFEHAFGIVQSGIGQLKTAYKKMPFKLSWTHYQILMRDVYKTQDCCLTFQGNGRQQKSEGGLLSGGYGFI